MDSKKSIHDERHSAHRLAGPGLLLEKTHSTATSHQLDEIYTKIPFTQERFIIVPYSYITKILNTALFRRQNSISQLQYLLAENALEQGNEPKLFTHQRSEHAKLAACLGVAILFKNGIPIQSIMKFAITAAYHDAATPAGGDAIIRIDKKRLCEEINFSKVMRLHEMEKVFADFSYDIDEAQSWIDGKGVYGTLLDIVDKISYTLLDMHYLVKDHDHSSIISDFTRKNPNFGEIWKDLSVTANGVSFTNPENLYRFLLARALMYDTLYKNPLCRKLEVLCSKVIRDNLINGSITCDQLIEQNDSWLKNLFDYRHLVMRAKNLHHRFVKNEDDARLLASNLGEGLICLEHTPTLKTGLDFLIRKNDSSRPLVNSLDINQLIDLEAISQNRQGWHLYFFPS
ncbi:hypothetical protein HGA64_02215 [Candidatus Falkowbacteria bacterium]|nr:hypothetical protein [Candidatus Falkowbacteria bacterium]